MNYKRLLLSIGLIGITSITNAQTLIQTSQYSFETPEQALRELQFPTPTPSPTNAEIFARSEAINQAVENRRGLNNNILQYQSHYSFYTTIFSGLRRFGIGMTVSELNYDGLYLSEDAARAAQEDRENPLPSALPFLVWHITVPETVHSGEPIRLEIALKNIADHDIVSGMSLVSTSFCLSSIKLVKVGDPSIPVMMTKRGIKAFHNGWFGRGVRYGGVVIKSNDELKLDVVEKIKITDFYDVSEPGEYELTFYTRRFIDENGNPAEDQELEYPRKATVRFTVLPKGED